MARIEVGDYLIESSDTCWTIVRASTKKDGTKYFGADRTYYNNFDSAMMAVFNMKLRASDAQSVLGLRQAAMGALSEIKHICAPLRAEVALELTGEK